MLIFGIDPGLNITGLGLIKVDKLKFNYRFSGYIKTKGSINEKIFTIVEGVKKCVEQYQPQVVVIERIFMRPDRPNPDTIIKLAQARGAIVNTITQANISIVEYSANQIKKAVVGKGHAHKDQISFMVQHLLKLNKKAQADASDALAAAICHAYHLL